MEITNEIKAKVFAQYLGQIVSCPYLKCATYELTTVSKQHIHDLDKLILKPISSITDDDAIEVAKILTSKCSTYLYYEGVEWKFKCDIVSGQSHAYWEDTRISINHAGDGIFMISNGNSRRYVPEILTYQFLQSRGYDLPQYLLGGKTLQEAGLAIYKH